METKQTAKKVTNVAYTSIDSYHELINSGQFAREKALAIKAMLTFGQPITSRKLSELILKERTNCTRILYDLENSGIVKVCKTDACAITKRRVQYYELIKSFVLPA